MSFQLGIIYFPVVMSVFGDIVNVETGIAEEFKHNDQPNPTLDARNCIAR